MIARMDVISVNCPHTPSTFHLMNARRLKLMKKDAVIVNTSRGEVIDENALTRMLRSGEIAGAGLDVFEKGREVNPRLRELPNVVLLPHMGSATREGRTRWARRSSSTSRPSPTVTVRRTWSCPRCCEGSPDAPGKARPTRNTRRRWNAPTGKIGAFLVFRAFGPLFRRRTCVAAATCDGKSAKTRQEQMRRREGEPGRSASSTGAHAPATGSIRKEPVHR
jgi:hypothetical protein